MGILSTNRAQITSGGLISASFVSDVYDVLTGAKADTIVISGSTINHGLSVSGSLNVSSAISASFITGSITGNVTGNLTGTASLATSAVSSTTSTDVEPLTVVFSRSDGINLNIISGEVTSSGEVKPNTHILCQQSSSKMQLWFNGNKIAETDINLTKSTKNNSNLYIGSKGLISTADADSSEHKHYSGSLSNINIWSKAYTTTEITNISESINASPYVGNIFYSSGFATITHPLYHDILSGSVELSGGINTLQFQGSHLIYEHEYQCTVQEHEYNTTTNPSVLKNEGEPYVLEGFTTSSFFKPYVTTIGLYNEGYELLAVAKLGQPIRMSDETDTTFIIRYDT